MAGRWQIVTLETPRGPITSRAGTYDWLAAAQIEARGLQSTADNPDLIALACCEACECSPEGCDVCNPDALSERLDGTQVDGNAPEPKLGEVIVDD